MVIVVVVEEEEAYQVYYEPKRWHSEQALGLYALRLVNPLNAFTKHIEGDEDQEYTVEQSTEGLHSPVPVSVVLVYIHLGDVRSTETNEKSCAIKEHVKGVSD